LLIGYADALLSTFGSPSIPSAPTQTNARIPCPHQR
jgi:hypothetical protein